MRWLRASWTQRTLVTLLVASLGTVLFAAADTPSRHSASYADWVRTQLRIPACAALDEALTTADEQARTFEGFLNAFIDAYEAQRPEASLARAFLAHDLPPEALITYLQSRFARVVGDAVLPRLVMTATSAPTAHSADRNAAALAPLLKDDHAALPAGLLPQWASHTLVVLPLRLLWDAQPLGP